MPVHKDDRPTETILVHTVRAVRDAVDIARKAGRSIALVPTMGALHAGHVSLIEAATATRAFTVVSIYVNPTQFGPNEDLDNYPRTLDADREACRAAGADLIFAPDTPAMYPPDDQTIVKPGTLASTMCGAQRPGHFDGVCTVVAKLFNIVRPDVAYFGQKDAQQALIITQMAEDLRFGIDIAVCPIVREPDGLARSSRNEYLSAAQRRQSLCLYRALCSGRDALESGAAPTEQIVKEMERIVSEADRGVEAPVSVEYLVIVDPRTLDPVVQPVDQVLLAGAIRVGATRLIDNLVLDLGRNRA